MKILVTGGAGYVGSVLVPYLLSRDHQVKVLDNLTYGIGGLFGCFNDTNFEFTEGDVRNKDVVKEAIKDVDIIIHLAAMVGYPICKRDPDKAIAINAEGTRTLTRETSKEVPIIFASTGSCYGNLEEICQEDLPLRPKTVYAESKALAEAHLQKRGNCIIYRFATGYGISPRMRLDLMINDFCYKAVHEKNLIVYERHFQRTFIHVIDMARAFVFAIENFNELKDEVYNVGSEAMNLTKQKIAETIKSRVDYYLHYADFGHDEDKRNYVVKYEKIHKAGFSVCVGLNEGINQLINLFNVMEIKSIYSNV